MINYDIFYGFVALIYFSGKMSGFILPYNKKVRKNKAPAPEIVDIRNKFTDVLKRQVRHSRFEAVLTWLVFRNKARISP